MKKHALPIASLLLIAMLAASAASCGGDAPAADTTASGDASTEPVETSVIDTLAKADYRATSSVSSAKHSPSAATTLT